MMPQPDTPARRFTKRIGLGVVGLCLFLAVPAPAQAQDLAGQLVVYNAGSLAVPFQRLLAAFVARHPGVRPDQEHSGSLAAVRKLTELDRIPDVIAVADRTLFPRLLEPDYTRWYATFAHNAMVLAVAPHVTTANERLAADWPAILLQEDVRWGQADPAVDPAGYRTLMVFDLAERYYEAPGLGRRLRDRTEQRFVRPKSADLVALLQLGELDYAWMYASMAWLHDLRAVELPEAVNLSSPAYADTYATVRVEVPGRSARPQDRVVLPGRPIEFALSIPRAAPHPDLAVAFVAFVLSDEGRAILESSGLRTFTPAVVEGTPPPGIPLE